MTLFNKYTSKDEMLSQALRKLSKNTQVTSIGEGSLARSLAEIMIDELSGFYTQMDYNYKATLLTYASGRSLDLLGEMYGVERKAYNNAKKEEQRLNRFYFYLTSPYGSDLTIPRGTEVRTAEEDFVGDAYVYRTDADAFIPAGRLRAYVPIVPKFEGFAFTAGKNTLTEHSYEGPVGVTILCTNPRVIETRVGFESDSAFRARINKQIRSESGGSEQSLRFSALNIQGVRDVVIDNTPFGLGTVRAIIVPERYQEADVVMPRAMAAMRDAAPVGVRVDVVAPTYVGLDADVNVMVRRTVNESQTIRADALARSAIVNYIASLLPGSTFRYNRLVENILDASDLIEDVSFTQLRINGQEVLRQNYELGRIEMLIPDTITVKQTSV